MNMQTRQSHKEVIALDADDHLQRPMTIQSSVSEERLFQMQADRIPMRSLLAACAV